MFFMPSGLQLIPKRVFNDQWALVGVPLCVTLSGRLEGTLRKVYGGKAQAAS